MVKSCLPEFSDLSEFFLRYKFYAMGPCLSFHNIVEYLHFENMMNH